MPEVFTLHGLTLLLTAGILASWAILFLLTKRLKASSTKLKALYRRTEAINTELTQYKTQFSQEVLHDSVTGLFSLAVFKEQVQLILKQSERYNNSFSLIFLDLKNFSAINNTLGYELGNQLLKEVAERLESTIRQADTVCRFSGDIFVILLSKLSHPESASLATQRFFKALMEPFLMDGRLFSLPANAGIAIYPQHGNNVDLLMRNAAHALSQAKLAGAQQLQFYNQDMHDQGQREFLLSSALSRSSFFEELIIEYQPQIDLRDNRIFCWEVLLRWQHAELGMITAGEFIQLAESNGRIEAIGEWVLHRVCKQLQEWRLRGYELPAIAINVSMRQLESHHFFSQVLHLLQETQVKPSLLTFEIAEKDILKRNESIEKTFTLLSQLGVHLSVDHFSAGDMLLRYLKHLPVDCLKISSSFVRDLATHKACEAIVKMMIELANGSNKRIVAMGVETEAQKAILEQLGCHFVQGHLFSTALSENEVTAKLDLSKAKSVQQDNIPVS